MRKSVDLTGKRFGLLTALERVPERKNGQAFRWICKCDCGSVRDYNYASLTQGKSTTCGVGCSLRKHPLRGTPTETSWRKLLSRCKYDEYKEWHGDVSVCDRWDPQKGGSFENFAEDMGERLEGCTLNRVNGAKIYSKETCEWASLSMQSFDQKQKKHNSSGRTGVRWREERNVWEASICKNREVIRLYYGSSFDEACKAREKAELELYGFTKE